MCRLEPVLGQVVLDVYRYVLRKTIELHLVNLVNLTFFEFLILNFELNAYSLQVSIREKRTPTPNPTQPPPKKDK
jgi:hypothetical protein